MQRSEDLCAIPRNLRDESAFFCSSPYLSSPREFTPTFSVRAPRFLRRACGDSPPASPPDCTPTLSVGVVRAFHCHTS
jgi:hypothetical protein